MTGIRTQGKFKFLLVTLLLMMFASPYLGYISGGRIISGLLLLLVVFAVVYTTIDRKNIFILACTLATLVSASFILHLIYELAFLKNIHLLLSIIFYGLAIIIIFKKIFLQHRHKSQMIYGALCLYLLIGLNYAEIYLLIENIQPCSIVFSRVACTVSQMDNFNLYYFSYTTLTTVGFGDIVPLSTYAKSIVILEQITGVLYLAVFVSRLVGVLAKSEEY